MAEKKDIAASEAGKALQQLLTDNGAIDVQALNDLLASKGLKAVASGISEAKYSRVEHQRKWLVAKDLTEDEAVLIKSLPDVLGSAPLPSEVEGRPLTQVEIDKVVGELQPLRQVEDIVKGRKEALRAIALNAVSAMNEDDPFATGTLASPTHGYKLVVTTAERGGEPNLAALEDMVESKVWDAITDQVVTRQVNEEKLAAALATCRECGKQQHTKAVKHEFWPMVSFEEFQAVVPEKTVSRVLNVRPLKPGDEV